MRALHWMMLVVPLAVGCDGLFPLEQLMKQCVAVCEDMVAYAERCGWERRAFVGLPTPCEETCAEEVAEAEGGCGSEVGARIDCYGSITWQELECTEEVLWEQLDTCSEEDDAASECKNSDTGSTGD